MIIHVWPAVYDLSITPAALAERRPESRFFCGFGVGLHALTHTHINEDRAFGSAFQFREYLGPGVRYVPDSHDEVGARLQHASSGGIRNCNDGVSYGSVAFRYNFP